MRWQTTELPTVEKNSIAESASSRALSATDMPRMSVVRTSIASRTLSLVVINSLLPR